MSRFKFRARHKHRPRHISGQMNKTEHRYALVLEAKKRSGEILEWAFEAFKLRLADNTFFTPDFVVYSTDGAVELHEVKAATKKGRILIEDDAAVKIKVAAEQHPFRFLLVYEQAGVWMQREYGDA